MSFSKKYTKILNIVKEEIEQVTAGLTSNIEIQEPLKSRLFGLLNAPSKHIRPLLSFLYLKALGYNINELQISLQIAVELIHNASLIHDDVIDESNKRRNENTLNYEFGNKLAVLSGDYLLSAALKNLLKLNNPQIIKIFTETLEDMTNGEITQHLSKYKIPTLNEYILKSEQKTAKLFEAGLSSALLLANSKDNASEFTKSFGIAFQIRDDLINVQTSKSDIKDGIFTAPVIYSQNTENISEGIEKTRFLLNNYIDRALSSIKHIEDNNYKRALTELLGLFRHE